MKDGEINAIHQLSANKAANNIIDSRHLDSRSIDKASKDTALYNYTFPERQNKNSVPVYKILNRKNSGNLANRIMRRIASKLPKIEIPKIGIKAQTDIFYQNIINNLEKHSNLPLGFLHQTILNQTLENQRIKDLGENTMKSNIKTFIRNNCYRTISNSIIESSGEGGLGASAPSDAWAQYKKPNELDREKKRKAYEELQKVEKKDPNFVLPPGTPLPDSVGPDTDGPSGGIDIVTNTKKDGTDYWNTGLTGGSGLVIVLPSGDPATRSDNIDPFSPEAIKEKIKEKEEEKIRAAQKAAYRPRRRVLENGKWVWKPEHSVKPKYESFNSTLMRIWEGSDQSEVLKLTPNGVVAVPAVGGVAVSGGPGASASGAGGPGAAAPGAGGSGKSGGTKRTLGEVAPVDEDEAAAAAAPMDEKERMIIGRNQPSENEELLRAAILAIIGAGSQKLPGPWGALARTVAMTYAIPDRFRRAMNNEEGTSDLPAAITGSIADAAAISAGRSVVTLTSPNSTGVRRAENLVAKETLVQAEKAGIIQHMKKRGIATVPGRDGAPPTPLTALQMANVVAKMEKDASNVIIHTRGIEHAIAQPGAKATLPANRNELDLYYPSGNTVKVSVEQPKLDILIPRSGRVATTIKELAPTSAVKAGTIVVPAAVTAAQQYIARTDKNPLELSGPEDNQTAIEAELAGNWWYTERYNNWFAKTFYWLTTDKSNWGTQIKDPHDLAIAKAASRTMTTKEKLDYDTQQKNRAAAAAVNIPPSSP